MCCNRVPAVTLGSLLVCAVLQLTLCCGCGGGCVSVRPACVTSRARDTLAPVLVVHELLDEHMRRVVRDAHGMGVLVVLVVVVVVAMHRGAECVYSHGTCLHVGVLYHTSVSSVIAPTTSTLHCSTRGPDMGSCTAPGKGLCTRSRQRRQRLGYVPMLPRAVVSVLMLVLVLVPVPVPALSLSVTSACSVSPRPRLRALVKAGMVPSQPPAIMMTPLLAVSTVTGTWTCGRAVEGAASVTF